MNRRRRVVLAAVALLGSVAAGCGSDDSGAGPPSATVGPATTVAGGSDLLPSSETVVTAPAGCTGRFLGLGDSIAAQSVGPATDRLRDMGLTTHLDVRWGTGPLDHDPDWVAIARQLQDDFRPTVVLAVFYGNYAQPIEGIGPDTPEEYARWGERTAEMTRIFTDAGARVVWLQPPPRPGGTVSPTWGATAAAVSAIPGVSLRPTGALVAGPDGTWSPDLRDPDGVHLTREGGDLMAADIVLGALEAAGC